MKTANSVPGYGPGLVSLDKIIQEISPDLIATLAHEDQLVIANLLPGTTVDILTTSNSVEMRCG